MQHQDRAHETEHEAEPLNAGDRLPHEADGDRRRQDRLQPRDQRRYSGWHALADRREHAAKAEPVHQRTGREAMGGLRTAQETRASDGCDQRHEDDDKDHAHGQERQRLDVRQAIAGAYKAGAPKQNENDRSSRDRQLREARWFWWHKGLC